MRFDNIKCKFQSLKEIPTSDYCIDVLFDVLEISVIIKLFIALLFEKQIIILANQNMLLFCICEAILKLIFPFRWLYTYVPNLSSEKNEILDINRPYLIGMICTKITASELNSKYPSNIICDVGSSTLYGNVANLKLPFNEEMKIKTKLLLLKNKYKNNYDEFDIEEVSSNENDFSKKESTDQYEDVDFNLLFSQNVQNIFFKIFRNNLMNLKKEYIINGVFNSQKFLDSFDEEEYKLFFEKIIVTSAFDYFISSMKYLDNSLSFRFNLIYNYADNKLKGKIRNINYYNYILNVPKKLINNYIYINEDEQDDNYISSMIDNYNKISEIIEENLDKNLRYSIGIRKISNKIKQKFSYLNFYGKNGFIEFIKKYNHLINYEEVLLEESINLYRNLYSISILNLKKNIIQVPGIERHHLYLILALYFYNYLDTEKNINNNRCKLNKELIFNLFLKAYMKNQDEFPRNLFITILQFFSLDELKKIKMTNLKYIDKTIQYQILKIQKISYDSLVLPDLYGEENSKSKSNSDELDLLMNKRRFRSNTRGKTSISPSFIFLNKILFNNKKNEGEKSIEEEEENDELSTTEVLEKTKLNVLGDKFNNNNNDNNESRSKTNKSGIQQIITSNNKYQTTKAIYKHKKREHSELKSWNDIKFSNNNTQMKKNSKPNIMSSITILNNYNPDPMVISEKICNKLYTFLYGKKRLENFTEKNSDLNFLKELAHSDAFEELKRLILSLKYISLDNLSSLTKNYYCFWLNIYNFLTIFTVIYKCEIASNLYEWLRFLKNSYFTIGNVEISLLEIEAHILRGENIIKQIYGISINNEQLKLPKIKKFDSIINYGISLPTISSPDIRIYYPTDLVDNLKYNASLFFYKNIKLDAKNKIIEVPEYIYMIEPKFDFKMKEYEEFLEENLNIIIKENPEIKIVTKKYNWNLNFSTFKNY